MKKPEYQKNHTYQGSDNLCFQSYKWKMDMPKKLEITTHFWSVISNVDATPLHVGIFPVLYP